MYAELPAPSPIAPPRISTTTARSSPETRAAVTGLERTGKDPNGGAAIRIIRAFMDKAYSPGEIETRIYQRWESSGAFAPRGDGEPYCIMLPPPNVTGTLHMGHAFQHTLMDTLTRWHRMRGFAALWQPGTDHAGIATQMVVERNLLAEGTHRHELGRDKFLERVWQWKAESG